jgi:NTP pyrophosphatase (non-canonical NTP hydrolase)
LGFWFNETLRSFNFWGFHSIKQQMTLLQQAKQFREAFEFSDQFTAHGFTLQERLIREEYGELLEACNVYLNDRENIDARSELLKEMADLVFVVYQMSAYLGFDLDEAMDRVFKSNMSKLGDDGKPVRREDNKVLKGPNYQPPSLLDLVSPLNDTDA